MYIDVYSDDGVNRSVSGMNGSNSPCGKLLGFRAFHPGAEVEAGQSGNGALDKKDFFQLLIDGNFNFNSHLITADNTW